MNPIAPIQSRGPERIIQDKIIAYLRVREWFVKETSGNLFQSGFPDLFACHYSYGARWIEVKNPKAYSFTAAQLRDFPAFCANGSGVWVMFDATDSEYEKLFKPCNWYWALLNISKH